LIGQGNPLFCRRHHGVDQQTCEAGAHGRGAQVQAAARRAGLDDLSGGKLLGLPTDRSVCYTNRARANDDEVDMPPDLLGGTGCSGGGGRFESEKKLSRPARPSLPRLISIGPGLPRSPVQTTALSEPNLEPVN